MTDAKRSDGDSWDLASSVGATATAVAARRALASKGPNPLIDDPRIHHVRYQDLTADPIGTLRTFYGKYGIPFTDATEAAMRDYMANNRSDRHGKFRYSTDILNTDIDALHAKFAPYRERFGIDIDQKH